MECKVCGDKTSYFHYGAECCMSCKIFFRRQIKQKQIIQCRFNTNACKINKITRRHCPACRLAMCYKIGMKKYFIRSPEENAQYRKELEDKRRYFIELKYKTAQIDTLDLLHNDRSLLNKNQWLFLSNLINKYDTLHDQQTKQLLYIQKLNPFKARFKLSLYEKLIKIYYNTTKSFIECIPEYEKLTLNNRLIINHRTLSFLIAMNSMNSMNKTGYRPYFDKNFQNIYEFYYGIEYIYQVEQLREKLYSIFNCDIIIYKIFFIIIIFSNLTTLNLSISIDNEYLYSQIFFHLQNYYIELLWNYILFRFRHEHMAIHLFSNIIQYCIHMQNFIYNLSEKIGSFRNVTDKLIKDFDLLMK